MIRAGLSHAPGLAPLAGVALLAAALQLVAVAPLAGQTADPDGGPGSAAAGPAGVYASPHGPLDASLDCGACHGAESWRVDPEEAAYDHDASGFPLEGRHASVRCIACHLDLGFDEPRIAADECASCHADVHQGSLGTSCVSCHDAESFDARDEPDVHARTSFPLTGAHLLVHCESCHFDDRRPRFDALDTECYSCHRSDYETTTAIDHPGRGFSTDCLECHNTVAWFHRARVPPPENGR